MHRKDSSSGILFLSVVGVFFIIFIIFSSISIKDKHEMMKPSSEQREKLVNRLVNCPDTKKSINASIFEITNMKDFNNFTENTIDSCTKEKLSK